MHVGAGDQAQTAVLWPDLRGDYWRQDAYSSDNIASQSVTVPYPWDGAVRAANADAEASLTYRMDLPTDATRLVYGGRLRNRGRNAHTESSRLRPLRRRVPSPQPRCDQPPGSSSGCARRTGKSVTNSRYGRGAAPLSGVAPKSSISSCSRA